MKVVVIGAGLGGLSAAAHLVRSDHDVTIVEREEIPGGRAGVIRSHGFTLDNGPTVLTMPDLLEEAFAAAGATMADHVTIKPVDPMYRACYPDGSTLFVRHGREAMTEEIRRFANDREAAAFERFSDWLAQLYAVEMRSFIDANFDSPLDLVKPWRDGLSLLKLGGFGKLDKRVASFFDDPRLQQIFSFQSMYAGLAPYEALALYAVITYMDSVQGVFVPEGGMHQMAAGLADAVERAGVTIRYSSPVTEIVRGANGSVRGVRIGQGDGSDLVEADAVVCNPDLPVAYRELLGDDVRAPRAARKGKYSPSCLLWVAGVEGLPPADAAHHNIHFGNDWDGSFKAIIDDGVRMPDPSILVTLHSLDDPSLAPDGCTSLYVLEPTPSLSGTIDWSRERDRIMGSLRRTVHSLGYPTDVVVEQIYDPQDWQRMGMEQGTPFALAHTFFQTGPFRPNNVDKRVPGLVFAGSSTLPGVGVPMVLVSGKLAAQRVDQYHRSGEM
ncbi:phytoene desaturase family protein [Ilumatobacter nonamiensis]|uniref:phytoene desaturase family protein n=1 Tax=Ilumatobacter nonamiensis TaxID=467093 RepID=UPI00058FE5DC|nr:phytoene desaturase family protein [Ilumatobacter nonamiensis]